MPTVDKIQVESETANLLIHHCFIKSTEVITGQNNQQKMFKRTKIERLLLSNKFVYLAFFYHRLLVNSRILDNELSIIVLIIIHSTRINLVYARCIKCLMEI